MTTLNDFYKVDGVDDVMADDHNSLLGGALLSKLNNSTAMSGNIKLDDAFVPMQNLDPNGANRNVEMPAISTASHAFFVTNTGSGSYTLALINTDASTLATLNAGESLLVIPDGTVYRASRAGIGLDGWAAAGETWTYASASTFTVSGDVTAKYKKSTKLRFVQTTTKYAVVVSATYSAPNTTIGIFVNTDYTIANTALASPHYSYLEAPSGFPEMFNWSPTWTDITMGNAVVTAKATFVRNICKFMVKLVHGSTTTIGATAIYLTPPVTMSSVYQSANLPIAQVWIHDATGTPKNGVAVYASTTSIQPLVMTNGAYVTSVAVRAGYPLTWATDDFISIIGEIVF